MIKIPMMLKRLKKMEAIHVFTQTEFDISPSTEIPPQENLSTTRSCFRNPENFLNQPATQNFSSEIDDVDEFSSMKNDTLHVNCAHTDSP